MSCDIPVSDSAEYNGTVITANFMRSRFETSCIIVVQTPQENMLMGEGTGIQFWWHNQWIGKISAKYLKLILISKCGTDEMFVACFWAFNWELKIQKNLALITAYTSTL